MNAKWDVALLLFWLCVLLCACTPQPAHEAQGYVEGRYTYMSTPVSGVLEKLNVKRGTLIRRGTVLYILEHQPESDAAVAAKENLQQSLSARNAILPTLEYSKLTFERYRILVPKNAIQQSQLDNAKSVYLANVAQLAQANANIAAARAQLAQANWTLQQKIGVAPVDGIVFDTYYRLGEYTQANQPILSLLSPDDIKAVFFVPEANLGRLQLGNAVRVHCNGCTQRIEGKINFISPSAEYTPPLIYSRETSAKLVFRIEASFARADAIKLHPGQPILVNYLP